MALQFYNTLTNRKEDFVPVEAGRVRMYSCGPTVYAPAHVGNFRAFVFADLVHRALLFSGYDVTWVMNITDVDDKTIRDSQAAGESLADFTAKWAGKVHADAEKLGLLAPHVEPRAVEHVPQQVAMIEALVEKFSHVRFEPSGFTKNPEIPYAKSITDYIFRWLASKFLSKEDQAQIGVQHVSS